MSDAATAELKVSAKPDAPSPPVILVVAAAFVAMQVGIAYAVQNLIGQRNVPVDETVAERKARAQCQAARNLALALSVLAFLSTFLLLGRVRRITYDLRRPLADGVKMRVSIRRSQVPQRE